MKHIVFDMMDSANKPEAIECPSCGGISYLKRVPRYDGFRKVGETLQCAACLHVFASESEVVFSERRASFRDSPGGLPDKSVALEALGVAEAGRCCRHCVHYVVNPFVQRCSLHGRIVEATDECSRFENKDG